MEGVQGRWVGPGWAGDVDFAVRDDDGPVAGVQVDVVSAAEQDQVRDLGFAAVDPGDQVVGVALDWWCAADDAPLVARVQRASHCARDQPFGATDVEWFGLRAEYQRDDLRVTGESSNGGC